MKNTFVLSCVVAAVVAGCLAGCASTDQGKASGLRAVNSPQARPPAPKEAADLREGKPAEILPDTHMSAGRLHETQGRFTRAVDQYREVIALSPKHVEAYNRLGMVLDKLGRFKEADEAFAKAIQLAPDRAYLHNNLGFSYILQTRWRDAEKELRRALELRPDFGRAAVNLGMVLAQQQRFDEALAQFQRSLPPGDAYYNLGLMYQSKRRQPEAAAAFKAALAVNPSMVAAQKRLDALPQAITDAAKPLEFPSALAQSDARPAGPTTQPGEPAEAIAKAESDAPIIEGGPSADESTSSSAMEENTSSDSGEQNTSPPSSESAEQHTSPQEIGGASAADEQPAGGTDGMEAAEEPTPDPVVEEGVAMPQPSVFLQGSPPADPELSAGTWGWWTGQLLLAGVTIPDVRDRAACWWTSLAYPLPIGAHLPAETAAPRMSENAGEADEAVLGFRPETPPEGSTAPTSAPE